MPALYHTILWSASPLPQIVVIFLDLRYNERMERKTYKLTFQPVPSGCWYANLRSALPKEQWDRLRRAAYARAGGRCSVCGAAGRLEAHEVWSYDDERHIQKLEDVVALCHACHEVVHIGRTALLGREPQAQAHFMKVNGCTQSEYHAALGEANRLNAERSRHEWMTDLSRLPQLLGAPAGRAEGTKTKSGGAAKEEGDE